MLAEAQRRARRAGKRRLSGWLHEAVDPDRGDARRSPGCTGDGGRSQRCRGRSGENREAYHCSAESKCGQCLAASPLRTATEPTSGRSTRWLSVAGTANTAIPPVDSAEPAWRGGKGAWRMPPTIPPMPGVWCGQGYTKSAVFAQAHSGAQEMSGRVIDPKKTTRYAELVGVRLAARGGASRGSTPLARMMQASC